MDNFPDWVVKDSYKLVDDLNRFKIKFNNFADNGNSNAPKADIAEIKVKIELARQLVFQVADAANLLEAWYG